MSGVRVRPATEADPAGIDAVESAAFGAHATHVLPLIRELRRTGAAVLELVAEAEAEAEEGVVGHLMLSRAWVDAPEGLVDVRVLSPLAVHPEHQGTGIGRALIERAAALSAAAGVPHVLLEGDPAYYSRVGFVAAAAEGYRAPSVRIPGPAFQVRHLPAHRPWMVGALIYPDAFWATDAVGLR